MTSKNSSGKDPVKDAGALGKQVPVAKDMTLPGERETVAPSGKGKKRVSETAVHEVRVPDVPSKKVRRGSSLKSNEPDGDNAPVDGSAITVVTSAAGGMGGLWTGLRISNCRHVLQFELAELLGFKKERIGRVYERF